jgi:hypothetical protein
MHRNQSPRRVKTGPKKRKEHFRVLVSAIQSRPAAGNAKSRHPPCPEEQSTFRHRTCEEREVNTKLLRSSIDFEGILSTSGSMIGIGCALLRVRWSSRPMVASIMRSSFERSIAVPSCTCQELSASQSLTHTHRTGRRFNRILERSGPPGSFNQGELTKMWFIAMFGTLAGDVPSA